MKKIILIIMLSIIGITQVKAQNYSTTADTTENTYTNNLIGMATNDKTIYKDQYVILRENDNYILVTGKLTLQNNLITGNDTKVYKATRTANGYNYYYEYTKNNESQTSIIVNNLIQTNINGTTTSSSNLIDEIRQREIEQNVFKIIIGILFGIFLIKGRTSIWV